MDQVLMPKMSDMMEEGKILVWAKKEGDTVKKGESIAEVETEKVNIDVESFFAGVLRKILVPVGQTVPVGTPIALVGKVDEPLDNAPAMPAGNSAGATPTTNGAAALPQPVAAMAVAGATVSGGRVKASPLAKRLAEENGIELALIFGTGPEGRIVKEDVEAAIAAKERQAARPTPPPMPEPADDQSATMPSTIVSPSEVDIIPLSNMRKTIAKRLQQSAQTAPHFYVTMAMDASNLVDLRDQLNDALARQKEELRISFNDLITFAVSRALTRHPELNVSFDGDRILQHHRINVGVAVALPTGLIVPVVKDADRRTEGDLASEIHRLVDAARNNKLKPDEFQGGTFTISNLGMLDVETFTAIINPPEVAILAVGAIHQVPAVWNDQVVVRQQIKMTLSSDHRAVDGAMAAYFMRDLKRFIEHPATLLM